MHHPRSLYGRYSSIVSRSNDRDKENINPDTWALQEGQNSCDNSLLDSSFNYSEDISLHSLAHPSALTSKRKNPKKHRRKSLVENYLQKLKQKQKQFSLKNDLSSLNENLHARQMVNEVKSEISSTLQVVPTYRPNGSISKQSTATPKQPAAHLMIHSAEVTRSKANLQKIYVGEKQCVSSYTYMSRLRTEQQASNSRNEIGAPLTSFEQNLPRPNPWNSFLTTGTVTRQSLRENDTIPLNRNTEYINNYNTELQDTRLLNFSNPFSFKEENELYQETETSYQTEITPVYQQTETAPVSHLTEITPVSQQTGTTPVSQQTEITPVSQQTGMTSACCIALPPDLDHLSQMICVLEKQSAKVGSNLPTRYQDLLEE